MALWRQITTIVDPHDEASGSTRTPAVHAQAETEIEISLPTAGDSEPDAHQTAISVGGCWYHEPDHRRLPLETEMSRSYEKC